MQNQPTLTDFATQVTPLLADLACISNLFSTYDRVPTLPSCVSDAPGVFVCRECAVYYDNKTVALNKDPHAKQACWLKRYRFWSDAFEDPIVYAWLTPDQRDHGLKHAKKHA